MDAAFLALMPEEDKVAVQDTQSLRASALQQLGARDTESMAEAYWLRGVMACDVVGLPQPKATYPIEIKFPDSGSMDIVGIGRPAYSQSHTSESWLVGSGGPARCRAGQLAVLLLAPWRQETNHCAW